MWPALEQFAQYLFRICNFVFSDDELSWRARDVLSLMEHLNQVLTHFLRRESHT